VDTLARGVALRDAGALLRRRWWVVLLCVVLIPGAVYVYSARQAETYEASVTVQPEDTGGTVATGSQLTSENGIGILEGYAGLGQVAGATERLLREPGSVGDLTSSVDNDTGWLKLTATAATPRLAVRSANAYATALLQYVKIDVRRRTDTAIVAARQSLATVRDSTQRSEVADTLSSLTALRDATTKPVSVVSTGNAGVASPHPARNALLALLLALLLAPALVLLVDRPDRTLRRPTELERVSGARLLTGLPQEAFSHSGRPRIDSAFQQLRDSLIYFDARSRPNTVAIASALAGEGRTTVAVGLAYAIARAGRRVLLVDADLRSPSVSARMGVPAAPGLRDVIGGHALQSAIHTVDGFDANLTVLPAGSPFPQAAELLDSAGIADLLARLSRGNDLVVIDTGPLLTTSGALGLVAGASGFVAVARLDQTPRDAVRRMMRLAARAGGRVLGVVATDATFTGAEFQPLAGSASSAQDQAAASTAVARVV
jgi:Mrp family chromosome partitioning ATPase